MDDLGGSDIFGDENNGRFSWISDWIKGSWGELLIFSKCSQKFTSHAHILFACTNVLQ